MKKSGKTIVDFENYKLRSTMNMIVGGGDDPGEGDGKPKPPPPPPPPPGPFGPIIVKAPR